MIVAMRKVLIAARAADREALLAALADLGVVHLLPVETAPSDEEEAARAAVTRMERAIDVLGGRKAAGDAGAIEALAAGDETVDILRRGSELNNRLTALMRELSAVEPWGETSRDQIDALAADGVTVNFWSVTSARATEVASEAQADAVIDLGAFGTGRTLLGLAGGEATWAKPADAIEVSAPDRSHAVVAAEAAEIDATLRADAQRLDALATRLADLRSALTTLRDGAAASSAARGAMNAADLFALQGWAPADAAETLAADLAGRGVGVAVETQTPGEDELPPTQIGYASWAGPIQGLFDILGTLPGYREIDLSSFFMVALPIFAAMLIGDTGYGLVFAIAPLVVWKKITAAAGKPTAQLVVVFGVATLIWGLMTGNVFGLSPHDLQQAGGVWAGLGSALDRAMVIRGSTDEVRAILIQISFILGSVHLVLAHLRAAAARWPDQTAFADLGWAVVLVGMLGVIWQLFFGATAPAWLARSSAVVVAVGWLPVILFGSPARNPIKRILGGFAASLLPMIGAFGDTMSYIRLMAVGMASFYIALAFNQLGVTIAGAGAWAWPMAALVVLFGHLLNIGLCLIAIFAHGVRLNMLEFSNNAGVQWAGHPYEPFARRQ